MLLKHLSPTLDFIEFVFSCTQVKCGICHELLLRGQKEEHEKKCPGTRSKPLVLQRNISRNSASIGKLRQVSISQAIHDASSDMVNTPPPPKENSAPSAGSVAIKPPVHVVRKPTVTTASVPAPLTRNNIASSTTNGHSRPILKAANIKERVRQHEETPHVFYGLHRVPPVHPDQGLGIIGVRGQLVSNRHVEWVAALAANAAIVQVSLPSSRVRPAPHRPPDRRIESPRPRG